MKKGALYRIAKSALSEKSYDKAECVVPSLFVAQSYDGGVFIYDNYVYFASPTTEKEKDGSVSASWLSFKKVKLDGTSTKKEADKYLFRLSDNTVSYRFVKGADGKVYCMYVQSNNLYSFNTETGVTTLLVQGADNYYFDTENLENGYVYYLMKVPAAMTADASEFSSYNQLYRVAPEATASMDADKAGYTVNDGAGKYKTYSFDKASLVKNNADFDGGDISQYPYVNLGRLVLDGRGSYGEGGAKTAFNDADEDNGHTAYTYAVLSYKEGRVVLTRTENITASSSSSAVVYTFKDGQIGGEWNTVKANENLFKVADDSTNASASAVYYEAGDNLAYLYISNGYVCRTVVKADGTAVEEDVRLSETSASSPTLWKIDSEYLYYYASGDSGNNLYRLKYNGEASDYKKNLLIGNEDKRDAKFSPAKILNVQYNDSWYMPEFAGNTLFYCNAQSFGSKSFDYIYIADLSGADGMMSADELKAYNEKYEAITEYFDDLSDTGDDGANLKLTLQYCFRAGELSAYDEFLAEAKEQGYKDYYRYGEYAQAEIAAFRNHTAHGDNDFATKFKDDSGKYYDRESYFINLVGEMTDADKDEISSIWRTDFVKPLPDLSDDSGAWSTKKNILVSVAVAAGSLAVIIGVTLPIVISHKKKAKQAADLEATRVRKPKIDTADDKSIDVYATEEKAEAGEESAENAGNAENAEPIEETNGGEENAAEDGAESGENAENKEE